MFDDMACTYRSNHLTIADRQQFTLAGEAWKAGGVSPLDNLKIKDLKMELKRRGISTGGKKKPEVEDIFRELRAGICTVPALLQSDPAASIITLNLDTYEICPTEPLLYMIPKDTLPTLSMRHIQNLRDTRESSMNKCSLQC